MAWSTSSAHAGAATARSRARRSSSANGVRAALARTPLIRSGPALEVRDLVRLPVGALLGAREIVLGLALGLFLLALAAGGGVVEEVAGSLLDTARDLVLCS